MKKTLTLLILMTLLASCTNNPSSSANNSSEASSVSETSNSTSAQSEISSSEDISQNPESSHNTESSELPSSSESSMSSETPSSESSEIPSSESSETPSSESSETPSSESSETPSAESSETPSSESSEIPSSESSETEDEVLTDIEEIKAVAATFDQSKFSKWGVYTSNVKAEITAQLLTLQDYITTKSGYNGQYKAFVANETGFITINISEPGYQYIKDYKDLQQVYTFSGYISVYNDEVEIDMGISAKPILHNGVSLDYNYKTFAVEEVSIANLRATVLAKELKINVKGIGWKQAIYKMDLQYVAKVVNATALFSDGTNVIEVHGHDKINNGLTVGQTYTVYGRPGLYNFRPELEYITVTASEESIELSLVDSPQITAVNIFSYSYLIDDDKDYLLAKNKQYSGIVNNVYYFEGYVNLYEKDGKIHLLLEDSFREEARSSEAAAFSAKSLSIKNEDSRNLNERGFEYSPFYDFYHNGEKFGVYLTPHSYSKVAWDVFVLTEPFAVE